MASDETSQRLLNWSRGSIEEIVNSISNAFRLFGASMDEVVLNIEIKQSRDPRVKKYHQIYRRTKKIKNKKKAAEKNQSYLVIGE